MSTKTKIVIGIFIIYTIVVTVLLLRANEKLSTATTDLSARDRKIDSLTTLNIRKLDEIPAFEQKVDSLAVMLSRVDVGIKDLQNEKESVGAKYDARREDLDGMSQDSLKQIALEK
jgi:hypothetical protein